ncbi:unnamed protein product [Durusdinium trenchii]|uniref:Uncharacterized protein n=1 Tax=Durusdinium trenchii TaxID=1381693 RepID=A0ABP0IFI2_9DINO
MSWAALVPLAGAMPILPFRSLCPPYMLDDADELNLESSHAEGWQCSLEESRQSFAQQLQAPRLEGRCSRDTSKGLKDLVEIDYY